MNRPSLVLVTLATTVLASGCATTDTRYAAAGTRECKAVATYSASEHIRNQVHGAPPPSELAQADGRAELGQARLRNPRTFGSRPGGGLVEDVLRDC